MSGVRCSVIRRSVRGSSPTSIRTLRSRPWCGTITSGWTVRGYPDGCPGGHSTALADYCGRGCSGDDPKIRRIESASADVERLRLLRRQLKRNSTRRSSPRSRRSSQAPRRITGLREMPGSSSAPSKTTKSTGQTQNRRLCGSRTSRSAPQPPLRFLNAQLFETCRTCTFVVEFAMNNASAISRFLRPWADQPQNLAFAR